MPAPLSLPALSLRLACALAMATTITACQTSAINTKPISNTQTAVTQNKAATDAQASSALTMDMSGRHEYQLENGLKVVIKEDHRAPVAMTMPSPSMASPCKPG